MTNREYMINLLLDGMEGSFERTNIDDGGASEEAMFYYNIACPYYLGDDRCKCKNTHYLSINRDMCVSCKSEWLNNEVDE